MLERILQIYRTSFGAVQNPVAKALELRANFWLTKEWRWLVILLMVVPQVLGDAQGYEKMGALYLLVAPIAIAIVAAFSYFMTFTINARILRLVFKWFGQHYSLDQARDIATVQALFSSTWVVVMVLTLLTKVVSSEVLQGIAGLLMLVAVVVLLVQGMRFQKHFLQIGWGTLIGGILVQMLLWFVLIIALMLVIIAPIIGLGIFAGLHAS